jgi:trehalose synthase
MQSRKENALIVNALQRCAAIVVQNSLREGFGLTVTEAMWKHLAVLGSNACGIRNQIRDGIDGIITNDPEDIDEIALNLWQMLGNPVWRYQMGRSAQMRVYEDFLIFKQVSRYLKLVINAMGIERASWRP